MTNVVTLIKNPDRGFTTFNIKEIYQGQDSLGKIVPNVDDMVIDWDAGTYRVMSVDSNNIPTLKLINLGTLSKSGIVLDGLSTYQPSVQELAFVDTTVTPYTVNIDSKFTISGVESVYAKLFVGTDLTVDSGVVISRNYNGSGTYTGENIILQPIDPTNPAIKRPPQFNTNETLLDGEIVTLVEYSQTGRPTGQHSFKVKNSSAIRSLNASSVVVVDVELVSGMLDTVENDLINVPANIPISGGDFQARLRYSDGSVSLIAIGNSKCKILGLDSFNTGLPGVTGQVVLVYYADRNEPIVNVTNSTNRSITHVYNIRAVNNLPDYSFKIYICPKWNPNSQLYGNEYYLTNLAYNIFIKLTNNQIGVELVGGGVVDYSASGKAQQIVMVVDLANVLPGHSGQKVIQSATIKYGPLDNIGWYIDYLNTNENIYGVRAYAEYSTVAPYALSIQSGAVSIEEWLGVLWLPLHAIFDPLVRLSAPTPTHFKLIYNGVESPVRNIADNWNQILPLEYGVNWTQYGTLQLVFLTQTVDDSVYNVLGVAPLKLQSTLT